MHKLEQIVKLAELTGQIKMIQNIASSALGELDKAVWDLIGPEILRDREQEAKAAEKALEEAEKLARENAPVQLLNGSTIQPNTNDKRPVSARPVRRIIEGQEADLTLRVFKQAEKEKEEAGTLSDPILIETPPLPESLEDTVTGGMTYDEARLFRLGLLKKKPRKARAVRPAPAPKRKRGLPRKNVKTSQ